MNAEKAALLARAESIINSASYSREDSARVDALLRLADAHTDVLTKFEIETAQEQRRRSITAQREIALGRAPSYVPPAAPDLEFRNFLRTGIRAAVTGGQTEGTGSQGGYLAPQSFSERLAVMLAAIDGLFAASTEFETARGTPMPYPCLDDSTNVGSIIAEGSTITADSPDLTFNVIQFGQTPTWRTTLVGVSVELVDDSFFDLEGVLAKAFAVRLQRGIGQAFVATLLSQAAVGATSAAAGSVAPGDLFAVAEALNPAYYASASWLMAQSTLLGILGTKTSTGAFVFPAAVDALGRPSLLGFPVYLCPSMPAVAAGAQSVTFGDHGSFIKRVVRNSLEVITLKQKYAILGKQAFFARWRVDGNLLLSPASGGSTAGVSPVQILQQHT